MTYLEKLQRIRAGDTSASSSGLSASGSPYSFPSSASPASFPSYPVSGSAASASSGSYGPYLQKLIDLRGGQTPVVGQIGLPTERIVSIPSTSSAGTASASAAKTSGMSNLDAARRLFGTGATAAAIQGASAARHSTAGQLTAGTSPQTARSTVGAALSAVNNRITEAGTKLNHTQLGRDFSTLLRAERGETYQTQPVSPSGYGPASSGPVTVPYDAKRAGLEARADFPYMTEEEKQTARTKSGTELGAYIASLDLTSRRRAAQAESRSRTASTLEQRNPAQDGQSRRTENPQGRILAARVTGNDAYALGKVQGISRRDLHAAPLAESAAGRKQAWEYLTDTQRDTVKKYAEAGDFQAVHDYYEAILPELNRQAAEESLEKQEKFSAEHPALSMPTQFAQGMAGAPLALGRTIAGNLRNEITGQYSDIDPNDPAFALTAAASAQGEGAERALENNTALSIMRGGVVSAAQNLALLWLGGGPAAPTAQSFVLGGMAVNAGGQTAYENLREGKTAGRTLLNALVDAGIETATETIGVERWFKALEQFDPRAIGSSLRQLVKQLPSQMIAEGMEEVIGNEAGQLWDMLSQGEKSEYARRVEELSSGGMDRKEAEREASLELHVYRDARAFAEAAVSVLLMDGAPMSLQTIQQNQSFSQIGKSIRQQEGGRGIDNTIQKGLAFPENSEAHTAAAKLEQQRQDTGKAADRDIGRQSFLNAAAFTELARTVEQRGDVLAQAKLREVYSKLDVDIYDKVALSDLRELARFAQNTVPTWEEYLSSRQLETDPARIPGMAELREQISRLDLDADGNPLVSYRDAVEVIREMYPGATDSEVQDIYRQYRNDRRTVLFGGHRLNLSEFTDLMRLSTDGDQLTRKQISGLFNQAILDTLDGTDAYERYVQPEAAQTVPENAAQETAQDQQEYADLPFSFGDYYGAEDAAPVEKTAPVQRETGQERTQTDTTGQERTDSAAPGLVRDAWTEENLSRRTAAELDDTARLLGRSVRFAESIREGTAQGEYRNGEIVIAKDADNPYRFIYGHEIGHSLEEAAPEEYRRFVEAVRPEIENEAAYIREEYQKQGIERTEAEALGEAANNYIGSLVNDTDTLRRFIDRHMEQKSVLGRLRDAVAKLWNRLRGLASGNVRKLQSASELLDAALDAGAKAVREGTSESSATRNDGEQYLIGKTADNQLFVEVEDDILHDVPEDRWVRTVKDNLRSKFPHGVTIGSNQIKIDAQSRKEMTYSRYMQWAYNQNPQKYADKLRATNNSDEILQASTAWVDEGLNHPRKDKIVDFASGHVLLRIGSNDYSARVVVGTERNGSMKLYDILDLEPTSFQRKETGAATSANPSPGAARSTATVSTDSIAQPNAERKSELSLKGTGMEAREAAEIRRDARETDRIVTDLMRDMGPSAVRRNTAQRKSNAELEAAKREQQALRQELETYWEQQSKRTETFTLRQDDVDKLARRLAREYGGTLDAADLSPRLKAAAEILLDVSSAQEMSVEDVYNAVRPIARDLVENAVEKVSRDDAGDWQEIKSRIRDGTVRISPQDAQDIPDFNAWRRQNFGRVKVSTNNGTAVDVLYHELSEQFPAYFPNWITAPSDQLVRLAEVYDSMRETYENPYSTDLDAATDATVLRILDGMDSLRQAKPTFADWRHETEKRYREQARQQIQEDRAEMNRRAGEWMEQKERQYAELARKKIEQEKQRREREAKALRESVSQQRAALRNQLRRTTDPKANRESANRLAKRLVSEYDSLAKPGVIGKTISEAAEYVWRTAQGQEEFSSDALRDILEPAAQNLVENAAKLVNAEQAKDWRDIRPLIQGRFSIPQSTADAWQDLGQWNRDNRGRMSAGVDASGRRSADSAYEELSRRWPQYFPAEVTDTRERLELMSAAWEHLQPTWENPHNSNLNAAVESAVTDLVNRIFNLRQVRQEGPTLADRMAERCEAERARADRMIQHAQEQRRKADQRYRDYVDRQKAALEIKKDRLIRERLEKVARSLGRMRTTQDYTAVVRFALNHLNEVSKLAVGEDFMGRANSTMEAMRGVISDIYRRQAKTYGSAFTVDSNVVDWIDSLEHNVNQMDIRDVKVLTEVFKAMEHEIRTHRQLITGEGPGGAEFRRSVFHAGERFIRDIQSSGGIQRGNRFQDAAAWLDDAIVQQTLSPLRAMRRWTGYQGDSPGYQLFQNMADGSRRSMDYQMRAWNPFREILQDEAFVRNFSGRHAEEITVRGWGPDGDTEVKIVPAMRVELYLHKLNGKQNLEHIEKGGVTVPDMRLYKKGDMEAAFNEGTTVRFSKDMIESITDKMSPQEKRFADLCFQYFNGMAPGEVNQVMETLKGYSVYLDRGHFPIITNHKYLRAAEFDSIKFDGTMEGRGEFKERQTGAKNPILLMGADYVVSRSIRRDAQFVGLAIPIRNFNKVWGVTQASFDEQGQRNGVTSSVQDALAHQWGDGALKYVEDLMADLQGVRQRKRSVWSKLSGAYARAKLTWNYSVALKQFASFPTAGAVVGRQALTKALFTNPEHLKLDRELIARFTPVLWYRSIGFRETELGDLTANRDFLDQLVRDHKTANWIQGMDIFTTERLWLAAEYYVRDNLSEFGLHREDVSGADENNQADAYYNAVAQVYNRVIEETQPNYTTMQRGANLRSDNEMFRSLLMFKTQPFQNLNILYDAIENYRAKANPKNGFSQEAKNQAGRDLSRAVFSQLAANALFVAIGALCDLPKGKKDKYADEEGNVTPLSVALALGKDMMGGAAGMVPAGTEMWDFFRAAAFHDRYYGIEASNISFVSDLASRFLSFASFVEKGLQVNEDGTRAGWNPFLMALESGRLIESVAEAFGLPAQNVAGMFTSTARIALRLSGSGTAGEYRMLTLTGNPVSSGAYDLLYKALAQEDFEAFSQIAASLQQNYRTSGGNPITGKSIRDRMLAKYRDEVKKSGGTRLSRKAMDYIGAVEKYQVDEEQPEDTFTEASMNAAQHRKYMEEYADRYRAIADAIDRSAGFALMENEQRNKAKKYADQLAAQSALADNSGGLRELDTKWMLWATGGEDYGVTEDMAILFKTAVDSTESDKDESGQPVSGSRKKKALALVKTWMPDLTKQQSRYLQSFYWETENAKLKKLKENGYR